MIKSLSSVVPSVLFQLLGTETAVKFDGVMTTFEVFIVGIFDNSDSKIIE